MVHLQDRRYEKYYRLILSGIGLGVIIFSAYQAVARPFRMEALILAVLSLILSRVTFTDVVSRSTTVTLITISEAFIYLSFLLSGIDDAILVTAVLTFSETIQYIQYAKGKKLYIAWVVASTCCSVYSFCLYCYIMFRFASIATIQPKDLFHLPPSLTFF